MIDAIGNTLAVGDKVVYSWSGATCMSPAIVLAIKERLVHIKLDYGGHKLVRPYSLCCYLRKEN